MQILKTVLVAICFLYFPLLASAFQATVPSQPATTAPGGTELTGLVSDVKGIAQIRDNENAPWRPCKKGTVVREQAEIRTGAHTAVTFDLPLGQKVTVSRLTILKVLRSTAQQTLCITDLGMPYGRTQYEIETAGVEYRSTIRSPNSTLAVRGTIVSLYDQRPYAPQAISFTGRAVYSAGRRTVSFGGKNAGRTEVRAQQDAASVALNNAVQDPVTVFARTSQEVPLVTNLLSSGAVFNIPGGNRIPTVSGGVPPTDQQLLALLPGTLDFVLRWSGNADLNLAVGNQIGAGEVLLPETGLNTTPSGGRIPFNHLGGPSGGIEIAFWKQSFPSSVYFTAAEHVSGPSTPFTLNVFEHGQTLPIFNGAGQFVNTLSAVSDPGSAIGGNVFVGVPSPPTFSQPAALHPTSARPR